MIKYTEIFYSIQGEGKYTGHASLFFRFWGCNLNCHGFGQKDPTNSDTWVLDFETFDLKENNVQTIEDLPVWKTGCDSSYSWAKKYAHLAEKSSVEDVVEKMLDKLPDRKWDDIHWVITGGEPLMNQRNIIALMDYMVENNCYPSNITIETNGTQVLRPEFIDAMQRLYLIGVTVSFSVSYKLFNVSGELNKKAFKPDVVNEYPLAGEVWLKPVVVDTDACWEELDYTVDEMRSQPNLSNVRVYVMPCGATLEEQEQDGYMRSIAEKALARKHNVSVRVHTWVFGNQVGT